MEVTANGLQNEYMREYRAKNKDKQKEYYKQYRADHKEQFKQYNKTYWERKAAAAQGE